MTRFLPIGLLLFVVSLPFAFAQPRPEAQPAPPAQPRDFLKAGKKYRFVLVSALNQPQDLEVLAEPTGDWVMVRYREGEVSAPSWINLAHVQQITSFEPLRKTAK